MTRFTAADLLDALDRSAESISGFPEFCNAHIIYGNSLLRAFLGPDSWMTTFDVIGFRVDICALDYSIHYSSNLPGYEGGVTAIPDHLMLGADPLQCTDVWGNFEFDLMNFTVRLQGEEKVLRLGPTDYKAAGVDLNSRMSTGAKVLRLLVHHCADRLFVPADTSLKQIGLDPASYAMVCELPEWEHPSILSGETKPSRVLFFSEVGSRT